MTQIVDQTTDVTPEPTLQAPHQDALPSETVLDDELVEDVSIDGMCGVY